MYLEPCQTSMIEFFRKILPVTFSLIVTNSFKAYFFFRFVEQINDWFLCDRNLRHERAKSFRQKAHL